MLLACTVWAVALKAQKSRGIALVNITLPGGMEPKAIERHHWTKGVRLCVEYNGQMHYIDSASIRGRGNSTWAKDKKPFLVRLPHEASMPGMPQGGRWALLANVMDHSQLRNALAFDLARQTSLDWTPQGRFADLRFNGSPMGLYYLTEPIDFTTDKQHRLGWAVVIKLDSYLKGGIETTLPDGTHPHCWQAVVRPRSLKVDTVSFVDWMIVNELTMNAEPHGPRSCYMHVTDGGTLCAGPVWDFDLAFNEVGVGADNNLRPVRFRGDMPNVRWLDADSLYCLDSGYLSRLKNYGFAVPAEAEMLQLMTRRWKTLRPRLVATQNFIDSLAESIRHNAEADQIRWQTADPARFDPSCSFEDALVRLRTLFVHRIGFMDKLLKWH